MVFIIGELINSSRPQVGKAISDKDDALIRMLAKSQIEAGAHAIDLNAGQSVGREEEDLLWLIEVVQAEVGPEVRLAIDTSNPEVMAAGLEACSGSPVLNSISNEKGKETLIELAAQRDVEVIGLALGKHGMPKTAEDRVREARALIEKCKQAGVNLDRLYIDVICMSVGSNPDQGREVLEAVRRTKRELGVKTFAAVSNASFGLPNRRLLNRTCLAMLLEAGLDGAILDPSDKGIRDTIYAACALRGEDSYCIQYIKYHRRDKGR